MILLSPATAVRPSTTSRVSPAGRHGLGRRRRDRIGWLSGNTGRRHFFVELTLASEARSVEARSLGMRRPLFVVFLSALGLCAFVGLVSASASAALPVYEGSMSFGAISGPSDPEEFSWEVQLGPGQELQGIDKLHAGVYYTEGHALAFDITAEAAHDVVGSTVPTSLEVTGENVVTLTVHHRAGNPAAGGAPFVYPIVPGAGWEGGFQVEIVAGPADEMELREERERIVREEWEAARRAGEREAAARACHVPSLTGEPLKAAKRRLRAADCSIGKVTKRHGATVKGGHVVGQRPRSGAVRAPGATVALTLVGR